MDYSLILNNLGAAVTLLLGMLGLIRPAAAAAFTSIQPVGIVGLSEIRATYGGFFSALGAYGLYAQVTDVFLVIGLAWLGAAVGRIVSIIVDRGCSSRNVGGVLFEAGIGVLFIVQ